MRHFTIAHGNPWDGIGLWGVFESHHEAENLAHYNLFNEDWWILEIEPLESPPLDVSGNI